MKKQKFTITESKYPSGKKFYLLNGYLNDERIRKKFKTKAHATSERDRLEVERLNLLGGSNLLSTKLSESQLRDAETASEFLTKHGYKSILESAEWFVQHYKPLADNLTIDEGIKRYLQARQSDCDMKIIGKVQYNNIRKELNRVSKYFENNKISMIKTDDLANFLKSKNCGLKTWNISRGELVTYYKWLVKEKYVAENFAQGLKRFKSNLINKTKGEAPILTPEEFSEFLSHLENNEELYKNIPYFAIAGFSGIRSCERTGEITKLLASDFKHEEKIIRIRAEISKVGEVRNTVMQPCLSMWLEKYPLEQYPIIPTPLRPLSTLRKKFEIKGNAFRHSFISYHVAKFRSMGETALQAGTSEAKIKTNYLNVVTPSEAKKWFNIVPIGTNIEDTNIIDFSSFNTAKTIN